MPVKYAKILGKYTNNRKRRPGWKKAEEEAAASASAADEFRADIILSSYSGAALYNSLFHTPLLCSYSAL